MRLLIGRQARIEPPPGFVPDHAWSPVEQYGNASGVQTKASESSPPPKPFVWSPNENIELADGRLWSKVASARSAATMVTA